ncbi:MAG: hypothetical protein JRH18_11385 [Deltaproteobacteria bacterium]|nr:hypothetical protein [Deltaproteobacteria bacterium]MBW1961802.1 hypothetical protein [Deltaproteobacteria bacterium]MBW1995092.1 hypothetical protein [Deltaproteobacteria bacterium]MBW2152260.1 hypothetical protein [Deltaproteobacteria bacterium]
MSILLFSSEQHEAGQRVKETINVHVPEQEIEIYHTLETLSRRLHKPNGDLSIMVLVAASKQELQKLISIRDLFDIPIILILPDRDKETITKGHKLFPRLISYIDDNFKDVELVLEKMLSNIYSSRKP